MINTFAKPIIPANEEIRLKNLSQYVVLNGYPDKYFNQVANIIATTFDTAIALVSLVGSEFVEFKGNFGMQEVIRVDRGVSLCSLAILDPEPTVFENTLDEPCLLANPVVAGEAGLRFYAGVPLATKEGFNIGTVCIADRHPRKFSKQELDLLKTFAETIIKELEDRQEMKGLHKE